MIAILVELIIAIAVAVLSYVLMPRPKAPKPEAAKEMDGPTAEAGREMTVVFGELTIKSPNCLWFGERSQKTYKVNS